MATNGAQPFEEWEKVESIPSSHPHDHNVYMHSKKLYENLVGTKLDHNMD